jgi:hypothetical protein
MSVKWLDRDLLRGPYLVLCLSDVAYREAFAELGVPPEGPWIATPQAHATAHTLKHPTTGQLCAVVCISVEESRTGIEIAGLLTHEAVHIWQHFRRWIGEHEPGDETEAYAIQTISQVLWASYVEQTQ